jgi:hypothetical protein
MKHLQDILGSIPGLAVATDPWICAQAALLQIQFMPSGIEDSEYGTKYSVQDRGRQKYVDFCQSLLQSLRTERLAFDRFRLAHHISERSNPTEEWGKAGDVVYRKRYDMGRALFDQKIADYAPIFSQVDLALTKGKELLVYNDQAPHLGTTAVERGTRWSTCVCPPWILIPVTG